MSKLLRRSIKKSTIPRTRHSSTPTTSPNFYWDASRGWIPRKLGTHSGAPSTTSTIFLPSRDVAVDFMHGFSAIVVIFLWDINTYSFFVQCVQIYFQFGPTSCTMWRTLWSIQKIFLFTSSPYITIGLLAFLVYQPYVILPFMSSPLITSSFEHFPWDTSLSHSCLRISDSIDSTVLYCLLHLLEWFSLLFMGVFLAITISPDSCCWVICAIWINGSELLDPACCDFESGISSRWKRATSWRQWQRTFEWMYF